MQWEQKMVRINGRRESKSGANTHYRLTTGKTVTRVQGIKLEKQGKLDGYHVMKRNGIEYLRDDPDKSTRDNIDEQPLI